MYNKWINIRYGANITSSGAPKELQLDFYEPRDDTSRQRPMLILMVGRGFRQVARNQFDLVGETFASLGYAVANLDYRVYDGEALPMDSITSFDNIFKARADLKAAIRFFRLDAYTNNFFRVDPNRIFVLGYSAGAIASLSAAYMNEGDTFPAFFRLLLELNGGFEGNSGHPGIDAEVSCSVVHQ